MHYFLLLITSSLLSLSVFAEAICPDQLKRIQQTQIEIAAIPIPEFSYTVNEENCAKVGPTLEAVDQIKPALASLLNQYENYYQTCDRDIEIIYSIEDTKINIIMMQTLRELAVNLGNECENN
ncbi:MAG: hypothetical protein NDI69_00010 [Bacteriovoracaceae bacterium]|nr:hypothetical protein [Bacteriovoracaceae bacterium]